MYVYIVWNKIIIIIIIIIIVLDRESFVSARLKIKGLLVPLYLFENRKHFGIGMDENPDILKVISLN